MKNTRSKHVAEDRAPRLSERWATVVDELRSRREALEARKQLERELSAFTSDAELADLQATLNRYADSEAGPVRDILARQQWRSVA